MKRYHEGRNGVGPPKKLMSVVGSIAHEQDTGHASPTESPRPVVPEIHSNPDVMVRNKRLFGSLMGHLNQAKKNLDKDALKIEQQATLNIAAAQKNQLENMRLLDLQREYQQCERDKAALTREVSELRKQFEQLPLDSSKWKEEQKKLEKYLFTVAEPSLAWLPARMNDVTESLLRSRAEKIEEMIKTRDGEDEQKLNSLGEKIAEMETKLQELEDKLAARG